MLDRSEGLTAEEVDAKKSLKNVLEDLERSVGIWKAEVISDDGKRALLHPLPYATADTAFGEHSLPVARARAFLNYIANPDYLVNRLLAMKNSLGAKDRKGVMCALEGTGPDRLLWVVDLAKIVARLNTLLESEIASEDELLQAQANRPTGNPMLLAKGKVSKHWAQDFYSLQTLPKDSKAIDKEAAELLKESTAGLYMNRLFKGYGNADAYCLPLAEFLKIG
ncbi:hypothetical protein VPNG_00860 [Cytospora leucostoma]|uniref:Uncharacterized protein n=1 Tax=Cytospora leucostoma TaxID=1230097 RepID=A0A423XN35_9PEZI|nr:hypothetical protein VPNG_00860 [Cytospora leucostoma]